MPPHRPYRVPSLTPSLVCRGAKFLVVASAVVLAGCATNAGNQHAQESSLRQARDSYLSQTQSDPLGAYLAANDITSGPRASANSKSHASRGLAGTALNLLGIKYRYGGEAPSTGFDCSGLVTYAAEKSLGLKLPRSSREIAREGQSVKRNELKKGDLVFFNTRGHRFSHVGIYLGDQKFVHAPRTGAVVRVDSMDQAYWKKRYNGARRLDTAHKPDPLVASRN